MQRTLKKIKENRYYQGTLGGHSVIHSNTQGTIKKHSENTHFLIAYMSQDVYLFKAKKCAKHSVSVHQHQCFSIGASSPVHQHQCISIIASASVHQYQCISISASAIVHQHQCTSISASVSMHQHQCIRISASASVHHIQCISTSIYVFDTWEYNFKIRHMLGHSGSSS